MKKLITIIALCFMHLFYAQYPVANMQNVDVNGNRISDCGTIAFGTASTVTIVFDFKVSKAATFDVGIFANFKLYRKYDNSSTEVELDGLIVNNSAFIQGTKWTGTFSKVLQASDFAPSGGKVYGRYNYNGGSQTTCYYSITKTTPTFDLSPIVISMPCGDVNPRTFSVFSSNVPSGANITYNWSYSGWSGNSNSSLSSITLTPNSGNTLPSEIYVTPYLNGVAQPSRTCSVQRTSVTSTATIIGATNICTGTTGYSISNIAAGQTVVWNLLNPSIANLSSQSNNSTNVTFNGNGAQTLIATITNTCGQQFTKSLVTNTSATTFTSNAIIQ